LRHHSIALFGRTRGNGPDRSLPGIDYPFFEGVVMRNEMMYRRAMWILACSLSWQVIPLPAQQTRTNAAPDPRSESFQAARALTSATYYFQGRVFLDERSSGSPLAGRRIDLHGPIDTFTVSDAAGIYGFSGLPAGIYHLSQELPPGWTQTVPPALSSGNDSLENLVVNLFFHMDTIARDADQYRRTPIASGGGGWSYVGYVVPPGLAADSQAAYDASSQSSNQFTITAHPYRYPDTTLRSTVDIFGIPYYHSGTLFTYAGGGRAARGEFILNLPPAQTGNIDWSGGFDFGSVPATSISGAVYEDLDNDGVRDAGEPGLPSVKLLLGGSVIDSAVTDPDGNYSFPSLPAGEHYVSQILSPGWRQTSPAVDTQLTDTGIAHNFNQLIRGAHIIAADAYRYKLQMVRFGGGGGTYMGYALPVPLAWTEYGSGSVGSVSYQTMRAWHTSSFGYGQVSGIVDTLGKINIDSIAEGFRKIGYRRVDGYSNSPTFSGIDFGAAIVRNAITVTTTPVGRVIIVDGMSYSSPRTFDWVSGSEHTVSTDSLQPGGLADIRYRWNSWSDAGMLTHIVAPVVPTTYTADLSTQFFVTTAADTGGSVSPASGWFDSAQTIQVAAVPIAGFGFVAWSGAGNGSYSGPANPANVSVQGPITQSADFRRLPVQVTIRSDPPGHAFRVDGNGPFTDTYIFVFNSGETHTISADGIQNGGTGVRYVWTSWSDSGTLEHNLPFPGKDTTIVVNFKTQFALTMTAASGGTATPVTAWYDSAAQVTISATPLAGYGFAGWIGTGAGSYTGPDNPAAVQLLAPVNETPTFTAMPEVTFTITASSAGQGAITPSGEIEVDSGASPQFIFQPDTGFEVTKVLVDGGEVDSTIHYTFGNINADHTIHVIFNKPRSRIALTVAQSGQSAVLSFGVRPGAAFGIWGVDPRASGVDSSEGEIEAPSPAAGDFDARFTNPCGDASYFGDGSRVDIRNFTRSAQTDSFLIRVRRTSTPDPVVLRWKGADIDMAFSGAVTIGRRAGMAVEMKTVDSLMIDDPAVTEVFLVANNPNLPVIYESGWNLVSIPVVVADGSVAVLFPGITGTPFSFDAASGYRMESELNPGEGYWLKFRDVVQALEYTGSGRHHDTIAVSVGWNLIGTLTEPVPVTSIGSDPPGIVTGEFFGYDRGYAATTSLEPRRGYWVKVSQAGQLVMSSTGVEVAGKIVIRSTGEMPPPPPAGAGGEKAMRPTGYSIGQNYPNPFNATTTLRYALPVDGVVRLRVFNILGQEVAVLEGGERKSGVHTVQWDASALPSGVYFCKITAGSFSEIRKMVLIR
jgi:hypothetical protein